MNTAKVVQVTECRIVILNVLQSGPKTWKDLRAAYYGDVRGVSKANTSFHNQTDRMIAAGLIKKEDAHYEITEAGLAMLASCTPEQVANAKSKARKDAEAKVA